ncbi:MAG: hypothetical protein GY841_15305 [FCB group bacterium]|nr:hypothetical protein [FCB group bacterium]
MDNASKLIELAQKRFVILTPADIKLFRAVAKGEGAYYSAGNEKEDDPANAENWGEERTLKADRIEWLCIDSDAKNLVTHKGLWVIGACIKESLELMFAHIIYPLCFEKCAFTAGLNILQSEIQGLSLQGTHVRNLNAHGIKIVGHVFLRSGFLSRGEVGLIGALIEGGLDCSGSQFNNKGGVTIGGDGMTVKGAVSLGDGFRSVGEVRLSGATIGGNLECDGGQFNNKGMTAIIGENIIIKGNVFLRDGFCATGEVNLCGATIGGILSCECGSFENESGQALNCKGATINGSVKLKDAFNAKGEVSLANTKVGGDIECDNGTFENKSGPAFSLDGVEVKGEVSLKDGFNANGEVCLVAAKIKESLDCRDSVFINDEGNAIDADGLTIGGDLHLRDDFSATGHINLIGSRIGGYFILTPNKSLGESEIDLSSARVNTLCDNIDRWSDEGYLKLNGLEYEKIAEDSSKQAGERVGWLRLQPDDQFRPQPYEQLAKVLMKSGHEGEAIQVLIAKNEDPVKLDNMSWYMRLWHWLLGKLIGYGYQPRKTLAYILFIISMGCILFSVGYQAKVISPSQKSAYEIVNGVKTDTISAEYPVFNAMLYSIDSFVPLVDLYQGKYWLPNANRANDFRIPHVATIPVSGGLLRYYLWFHIGCGWLLTSLFVAGLTGLVRKFH